MKVPMIDNWTAPYAAPLGDVAHAWRPNLPYRHPATTQ